MTVMKAAGRPPLQGPRVLPGGPAWGPSTSPVTEAAQLSYGAQNGFCFFG